MPTTIRENVLASLFAEISALTATVSGLTVERNRTEAIQSFPFVVVRDGGDVADRSRTSEDRFTVTADLHLYVESATDSALAAAIDSLLGPVCQRIAGGLTAASPLLAYAERVEVVATLDPEEIDSDAAVVVRVECEYVTAAGDLYSLPS
jgi:hypothetical protein